MPQRTTMTRDEWTREVRRLNRRPGAVLHRLRWRVLPPLVCRLRGHDFTTEQVSYDLAYEYCRRCRLGQN